jgi:anti-sigma factor RsiW
LGSGGCLAREELSAFALGRLSDEELEVVAAHLESCPECQGTLAALGNVEDAFTGRVRRAARASAYFRELNCGVAWRPRGRAASWRACDH